MTRNAIRLLMHELGDKAGVMDCHPHRFRHTFAIFYLRNGGNVFTLQELLGHSTLEMVQKYIAISNSDLINGHKLAGPMDKLMK